MRKLKVRIKEVYHEVVLGLKLDSSEVEHAKELKEMAREFTMQLPQKITPETTPSSFSCTAKFCLACGSLHVRIEGAASKEEARRRIREVLGKDYFNLRFEEETE